MMSLSNAHWKSCQPPVQDPAILAFQPPSPVKVSNSTKPIHVTNSEFIPKGAQTKIPSNCVLRETGTIDKLQHSYGFLKCLEREARLFFHFSEYNGDIELLKVGDCVEFQMSFDRRTGKPIAVALMRISTENMSLHVLNNKKVIGKVVVDAKVMKEEKNEICNPMLDEFSGRVSYEECGEHFFIPYRYEDIEGNDKIRQGDEVIFQVATDKRNGNVHACSIRLAQKPATERYEGVICSLKEGYGFIERADMVKEIFFHYSEYEGDINTIILGDDVEFSVQMRNGKEVAVDVIPLPEGTVIFEDVGIEKRRGRVISTLKQTRGRKLSDPLAGRIVYETVKGSIEIPYGDKDQSGEYTLLVGDLVDFNIATDRRDKLQRATNIEVIEDTFKISGENREQGFITSVKDGFGFIRCVNREARMFFHFSEIMKSRSDIKVNDEVEFTVVQDPASSNRQIAIRILYLEKGTINVESVLPGKMIGTVEKVSSKNSESDPGIIMYDVNGTKQMIPYSHKEVEHGVPNNGDKVEFFICESHKNHTKTAVKVKVLSDGTNKSANADEKNTGFIATLKDNFGFIETCNHDKEVFFHFSNFEGEANELELGDEVEYILAKKTNKVSAEVIRKLPKGSLILEDIHPEVLEGKVLRSLRIVNPDQDEYQGLIQVDSDDSIDTYPFGITSLVDKKDFLQKGDLVKFQIATVKSSGKKHAMKISAIRKFLRAYVESTKGQFGFLTYEAEEGKKLFFHMTEVANGVELKQGDEVEFVVVQNQRNKKYSACSIRKITNQQRPERLMSRLKSVCEESTGPKLTIIRQPRGPDGSKGFKTSHLKDH